MPRRSTQLRIVDHADPVGVDLPDGRTWAMSNARITWSRAECGAAGNTITGSLEERRRGYICGAVRCRHHLLVTATADRPGRRGLGRRQPSTVPRLVWMDGQPAPRGSCALDVIDLLGAQTCGEIASRFALTRRRVEQVARRAIAKLRAAGLDPKIVDAMAEALDHESNAARAQDLHAPGKVW